MKDFEPVKIKNLSQLGPKSFIPVSTEWLKNIESLKKETSKKDLKKIFVLIPFSTIKKTFKNVKNAEIYVWGNWLRSIGAVKNEFK